MKKIQYARLVCEESNMQPIEVGSVSSLYQSVETLDKECLCTDRCKELLLRPKNSMQAYCKSLKLNIDDLKPTEYFVCKDLINVTMMRRKSNSKILFAQGKEDFADFLFSFLTFPLGGVVNLMKRCSSMGSVDGLYKSIVDLDEDYWTVKEVKNMLFEPGLAPPQFTLSNQLLPIYDGSKHFCYTKHASGNFGLHLTSCYLTSTFMKVNSGQSTCTPLEFVDLISETGNYKGYVKGPTMYMATDYLIVKPMSPISVVSLLTSMSIPFNDLEEKEVSIGIKERVNILQVSLTSKSALTTGLRHLLTKVKEEN